jgi:hypothetical protein
MPLSPFRMFGVSAFFLGGAAGLVSAVMHALSGQWRAAAPGGIMALAALAFSILAFAQQWQRRE